MHAVVLIGIQGAGKTTYCLRHLLHSHLRLSLDLLKTRRREALLLQACLAAQQPFVVDNTNVTRQERARYLVAARRARFRTTGYFFAPDPPASMARNLGREPRYRVPPAGLYGTLKRLERPDLAEGFDELFTVRITDGEFIVSPMQ